MIQRHILRVDKVGIFPTNQLEKQDIIYKNYFSNLALQTGTNIDYQWTLSVS